MLSVKEAQEFRQILVGQETKLKNLKQQRDEFKARKDRAGQLKVAKEITATEGYLASLKSNLADAPVEPWEPIKVWEVIISHFNYQKTFEKDLAEFLTKAEGNVSYCLEWYACEIVKSQKKAQLTAWVHQLENIEDVTERVDTFYKYLPEFTQRMNEEVLRRARKQTSKSTSQSSNLVEAAQLEAVAEMLDGLDTYRVEWSKKHFESWKELNQE